MSNDFEKPSDAEEAFIARQELDRRKKWAAEQNARIASEEKERLKKEHWMKCPFCGMDLQEIELRGIKVDQCANCGGIFLNAGEIEKLSEREGIMGRAFSIFR